MTPPTLTTERLTLRPFSTDDADAFVSAIFGHPDIGWRYGMVADTSTPEIQKETALDWIEDANDHWATKGWGAWAICLRGEALGPDGALIGFCGFFTADKPVEDHELAYGVTKKYWDKGIATEATIASLNYIFREVGVERVETVAHPTVNLGSSRVLEKAGLDFLGEIDYMGSVAAGHGLFNYFGVDRDVWLRQRSHLKPGCSHARG